LRIIYLPGILVLSLLAERNTVGDGHVVTAGHGGGESAAVGARIRETALGGVRADFLGDRHGLVGWVLVDGNGTAATTDVAEVAIAAVVAVRGGGGGGSVEQLAVAHAEAAVALVGVLDAVVGRVTEGGAVVDGHVVRAVGVGAVEGAWSVVAVAADVVLVEFGNGYGQLEHTVGGVIGDFHLWVRVVVDIHHGGAAAEFLFITWAGGAAAGEGVYAPSQLTGWVDCQIAEALGAVLDAGDSVSFTGAVGLAHLDRHVGIGHGICVEKTEAAETGVVRIVTTAEIPIVFVAVERADGGVGCWERS